MNTTTHPLNVNGTTFENEVLKSDQPVLVDFWAEWCGPCKAMNPVIHDLAREYEGKIKITKVNVDENSNLAARFNIQSIPTLLVFKNGEVVSQIIGATSKMILKTKLNEQIAA